MLRQSKAMRIWNILYPVCIYFAVTTMALYLIHFIIPEASESKLFCQLLTSLAVLPVLISFYLKDEKLRGKEASFHAPRISLGSAAKIMGMFFAGGCFALALNNLLGMLQIASYSSSYSQIAKTFYAGRLLLEIVSLCIVIPIAEELLYRGIVYGRTRDWLGKRCAMVVSAIVFGLIHMNLVQFVYAAIFGLLLAYFMELSESIFGAVAAHMAANLTSVLRAETGAFAFMENRTAFLASTVLLFAAAAGGVFWMSRKEEKNSPRT